MTLHGKNIIHKHHPDHKLHLEFIKEAYTCNSCQEIGFGMRYSCPNTTCDFHIHDFCVKPPDETEHHFFRKINFTFADGPKNKRFLVLFCLHHYCALELETKIKRDDVNLFLQKKLSDDCELCGLKKLSNGRFTWGYVSENGDYQFHLHCVKKKLIEYRQMISLGLLDPTRRDQVLSQDDHQFMALVKKKRKGGKGSTVGKMIRFTFNLIATVLLGNPSGWIIDIVSMMFQNA